MVDEYLTLAASSRVDGSAAPGVEAEPVAAGVAAQLRAQLIDWQNNHDALLPIARASTMLPEAEALSAQLRAAAETALAALDDIESRRRTPAAEVAARSDVLDGVEQQHGALQLMVVAPVRRLVEAAAEVGKGAAAPAAQLHAAGGTGQ